MTDQHSNSKIIKLSITAVALFLVGYVTNILLARLFSTKSFGDIQVGLQSLQVAQSVITMGTATATLHFFSRYLSTNSLQHAASFRQWLFHTVLRNSGLVVMIIVPLIGAAYFTPLLNYSFNIEKLHIMGWFVLIGPFSAALYALTYYLLSERQAVLSLIVGKFMPQIVILICLVIAYVYFRDATRLTDVPAMYFLSLSSLIILAFFLERSYNPAQHCLEDTSSLADLKESWNTKSRQAFSSNVILAVMESSSIFVLEAMPNVREQDVGFFGACLSISGVILLSTVIYKALLPKVSSANGQPEKSQDLNRKIRKTTAINLVICISLSAAIAIFGKHLLRMFGLEYLPAYGPLLLMTAYATIFNLSYFSSRALPISGHTKEALLITCCSCAFLIGLSCLLTYFFHLYGNILALILAWIVYGSCNYAILRKKTGLNGLGFVVYRQQSTP